jgi:hypothetical protein
MLEVNILIESRGFKSIEPLNLRGLKHTWEGIGIRVSWELKSFQVEKSHKHVITGIIMVRHAWKLYPFLAGLKQ